MDYADNARSDEFTGKPIKVHVAGLFRPDGAQCCIHCYFHVDLNRSIEWPHGAHVRIVTDGKNYKAWEGKATLERGEVRCGASE